MSFPRLSLSAMLRRSHQQQRKPASTLFPTPSCVSPTPHEPSYARPSTPPIWGSAADLFTGVRDQSLYDDHVLDMMLDECALLEAAQPKLEVQVIVPVEHEHAQEEQEGRELLFDADVWVELARAEQAPRPVRRCKGACLVRRVCYADRDLEELRRLTEAFVRDYYDGECACLEAPVPRDMCLPGEDFWAARNGLRVGESAAGSASWETSAGSAPWEISAGNILPTRDEESIVSETTESVFDHMDDVVQGGLWEDAAAGDAEMSTVVYLPDRAHDMCYSPPTPWSIVSNVSEYHDGTLVEDTLEADEALRPDLPFPIYCFDTDKQQYYGYTAYNHLLVCSDARPIHNMC